MSFKLIDGNIPSGYMKSVSLLSISPNSANSFITKEGSVPSKNLFRSILGEIIFIIKFSGEFKTLLCLFKIRLPKIRFEIIKVIDNISVNNFALVVISNKMKNIQFLYRKIDQFSWKYCNKGFFNFKKYIPKIIQNIS